MAYTQPFEMMYPWLQGPVGDVSKGVQAGMQLASLPSEIGVRKANIPLIQAETEAKKAQLDSMRQLNALLSGGRELVPGAGTPAANLNSILTSPTTNLLWQQGTGHPSPYKTDIRMGRDGSVIEFIPGLPGSAKDVTPAGMRHQPTLPKPIPTDQGFQIPTPSGGAVPWMAPAPITYAPAEGINPGFPARPGEPQQLMPPSKGQNEPYKIGHVQEFKQTDGTSLYKVYKGKDAQSNDIWEDTGEGGKRGPGGLATSKEAQVIANRMWEEGGKNPAMIPTTKYIPTTGNFEPVLIPDIMQRIPSLTPNMATGIYFDRRANNGKGAFKMNTDQGAIELTSEQVQNMGLQVKEITPTSRTKTMQQLAPKVLERAYVVRNKLESQMDKLGPIESRARNLWANKIGNPDPEYVSLQTDSDLLATLLANMHVGASGAEQTIQRFTNMLQVKNQSPQNLLANVDEIIKYAEAAKQTTFGPGGANPPPPPPPPPPQEERKAIGGKNYIKKNGKWYEE